MMQQNSNNPVSPVTQFALLLSPIVITCFYLVYALTGWILDGRDKLNWAIEAPEVGLWVCAGTIAFSLLVMAYTWFKGAKRTHPLNISSIAHIVIAVLLTASIFVTVRL